MASEKEDKDARSTVVALLGMWQWDVIVFALGWFILLCEAPEWSGGLEDITRLFVHVAMSKERKRVTVISILCELSL